MRLGAPIFAKWNSPDEWAHAATKTGYSAVYYPIDHRADPETIRAYAESARRVELSKLPDDVPLMVEHLSTEQDSLDAVRYIQTVAQEVWVHFR